MHTCMCTRTHACTHTHFCTVAQMKTCKTEWFKIADYFIHFDDKINVLYVDICWVFQLFCWYSGVKCCCLFVCFLFCFYFYFYFCCCCYFFVILFLLGGGGGGGFIVVLFFGGGGWFVFCFLFLLMWKVSLCHDECSSGQLAVTKSSALAYFRKLWYKSGIFQMVHDGGGDSSVVRAPDSWLKGRGFESLLERRENFLLQGRLSVLTLISVSVPPPCYHSST